MELPLVSIIMSVYNTEEEQLRVAIDSILTQTYKNFEFIIVDDGSVYNVHETINSFQDRRINFIKNEKNIGLPASLNRAISFSRGKYIARMDSDDISLHSRIERQVKYLEKHDEVGVLGTNAKLFGTKTGAFRMPIRHEEIKTELLINSSMIHPSVMMRKSVIGDSPYDPNDKKAEDYKLWTKLIWETKFENLNEFLFLYRFHENQKSKVKDLEKEDHLNAIRMRMINKLDPNLTKSEVKLFLDSTNLKILEESDLFNLKILNHKLMKQNKSFETKALNKTLSTNLDREVYVFTKKNKILPQKFILPKSAKLNRFTFLKYMALFK